MSILYSVMRDKLSKDMDIEGEEFVQASELMDLFNDAIRECEAHIHKLGLEDTYFKTYDTPSLVSGTASYDLPTNIYENKILECVYNDGNKIFEVKRLKGKDKHLKRADIENNSGSNPIYLYDLENASAAAGKKWVLVPSSKETSTNIRRYYIRTAQKMTADASICDLPDVCLNFVYAYVTWRIWGKEGDGRAAEAKVEKDAQKELMLETLAEMTPDEENEQEADFSHYDEMS